MSACVNALLFSSKVSSGQSQSKMTSDSSGQCPRRISNQPPCHDEHHRAKRLSFLCFRAQTRFSGKRFGGSELINLIARVSQSERGRSRYCPEGWKRFAIGLGRLRSESPDHEHRGFRCLRTFKEHAISPERDGGSAGA